MSGQNFTSSLVIERAQQAINVNVCFILSLCTFYWTVCFDLYSMWTVRISGESVVPRLTILTHCSTVSAVTFLVCSESCMLSFSQLKMLLIGVRYTFDSWRRGESVGTCSWLGWFAVIIGHARLADEMDICQMHIYRIQVPCVRGWRVDALMYVLPLSRESSCRRHTNFWSSLWYGVTTFSKSAWLAWTNPPA